MAVLQAEVAQPAPAAISHVTESQQQIDALVHERDAWRPVPSRMASGRRVGEASNPGPARQRGPEEILNELEATLTMDSSDEEPLMRPVSGRNVVRRVSDAAQRSIGDPVHVSRRWFWPFSLQKEPHGLCRTARATGSPFWQQIRTTKTVLFHRQSPPLHML